MMPRASVGQSGIRSLLGFRAPFVSTDSSSPIERSSLRSRVPLSAAVAVTIALGIVGSHGMVAAAPTLILDQAEYVVQPGEIFDVKILIDGDLGQPDLQPLANGLFSYGWEMSFPAAMASANSLTVVPELDFWGFDAGALTEIAAGIAKAEGNVDQNTAQPYTGSHLATVGIQNMGNPGDSYILQLALAPHFPTEQLFLDGEGNVLDDVMVFGSARVFVTPEPASVWLLLMGVGVLGVMRRRFARRP